MKNFKTILKLTIGLIGMVMLVTSFFAPDFMAALMGTGAIGATAFITAGSEYNGKEALDLLLRPVEEKMLPTGIRVVDTGRSGSVKLTFFGAKRKLLMPYVSGWQGGTTSTKKQRKFEVEEFKAESAYSAQDYKDTILEQLRVITESNELSPAQALMKAEQMVFSNAVAQDIVRYFWLGDKSKTHTEPGTYPDGSTTYAAGDADKYYNQIDGVITSMKADKYQNYVDKQNFITGWNKTTYPTLYFKSDGTTVTAYLTAAARTAGTGAQFTFAAVTATGETYPVEKTITTTTGLGYGGKIRLLKAITNLTTFELHNAIEDYIIHVDITDTGVESTTDYVEGKLKTMIDRAPEVLKPFIRNGQAKFYCTGDVIDNYKDTLVTTTLESSRSEKINGILTYKYDGVQLVDMGIDSDIEKDFPSTFAQSYIILTVPDNLGLVLSHGNNTSNLSMWFNKDENQNRQRAQFEMGADYIIPELCVIAYEA